MFLIRTLINFFKDRQYRDLIFTSFGLILIGSVAYDYLEGLTWFDSIYF